MHLPVVGGRVRHRDSLVVADEADDTKGSVHSFELLDPTAVVNDADPRQHRDKPALLARGIGWKVPATQLEIESQKVEW
jgi:hypothetical protein